MKINYVGIDWVTATSANDGVGGRWYEILQNLAKTRSAVPDHIEQWSNGYYSGVGIDGLKWGYSGNLGYIMQASSSTANVVFPMIKQRPRRVTRLDLCVDVYLTKGPQHLARKAYAEVKEIGEKQRKYSLFEGTDNGATLYVGSRQSQQFGRLYDKGVESKSAPPGLYWRFETEYKKPLSTEVSELLSELTSEERHEQIKNRVANWFADRHINVAKVLANAAASPIVVMQRQTSVDRKIAWLHSQVSPTVRMLIDAGLGRQVLLSLIQDVDHLPVLVREAMDLQIDNSTGEVYNQKDWSHSINTQH